MARLRRKDLKNVTVLHPWGAPRLDLTAVFCPETSSSDFFFFVEEIKRSFLKINLMSFSIGRIIGCYEKNGFMEPRCFAFSGGRNRVYIDSGVSVQIKPLRPFGRFKMVIFAFQNITNCNVEIILSLTSVSFGSESLG